MSPNRVRVLSERIMSRGFEPTVGRLMENVRIEDIYLLSLLRVPHVLWEKSFFGFLILGVGFCWRRFRKSCARSLGFCLLRR